MAALESSSVSTPKTTATVPDRKGRGRHHVNAAANATPQTRFPGRPASRSIALLLTPPRRAAVRCRPMTLMEVMIASFVTMIVIGSALMSLTVMSSSAQLAAQHTAAMSLCQERLEEIRAAPFDQLTVENFPTENGLALTHTESPVGQTLECERIVAITDDSQAGWEARRVVVTVTWVFRNRPNDERIETIVHDL